MLLIWMLTNVTKLPLKAERETLPDKYYISKQRLKLLKIQLHKDEQLLLANNIFIKDHVKGGIVQVVTSS